jgi:transposase
MAVSSAPHGRHLTRYYNDALHARYALAKPTPSSGSYVVQRIITPCAHRGLTHTLIKTPTTPLTPILKADVFQPLTVPSASILVPPRPCFAPFPTNAKKRKMNAMAQKKTYLADGEHYRVYKIRLHPTSEQSDFLRRWMAAKRLFYNQAVFDINNLYTRVPREDWPFPWLRQFGREIVTEDHPWTASVIQVITGGATKDAWSSFETNLRKKETNPNHRFRLQFQSLRRLDITPTEVVDCGPPGVRKDNGKDTCNCLLKAFLPAASFRKVDGSRMDMECVFGGGMPGALRATDSKNTVMQLPAEKKPKLTPLIMWEKRTSRWYLILKRVVMRPPDDRPAHNRNVLALDPGARKFCAFYRPDGTHGELLKGADSYIQKQCHKAARERSRADTATNHDDWRRHRGRMLRTLARIRNWTKNAHYEAIQRCFTLADFIILPMFETQRMSRRATRIFGNKTARQLYTWSHYSFSQRLYYKSQTTANKQVAFTREPGTSKTCDCCGSWNAKLIGGNGTEYFTCRACGYAADRDHHGARGNLLSALGAALNVGPDDVER